MAMTPQEFVEYYDFRERTLIITPVAVLIVNEDLTRVHIEFQVAVVSPLPLLDTNDVRVSTDPAVTTASGFPVKQTFPKVFSIVPYGLLVGKAWYAVGVPAATPLTVLEIYYRPKRS